VWNEVCATCIHVHAQKASARGKNVASERQLGTITHTYTHTHIHVGIMPIKKDRVDFRLIPYYFDRWLAKKSVRGEMPVYVALEDCGNRGWFEECPSKMQVCMWTPSCVYACMRWLLVVRDNLLLKRQTWMRDYFHIVHIYIYIYIYIYICSSIHWFSKGIAYIFRSFFRLRVFVWYTYTYTCIYIYIYIHTYIHKICTYLCDIHACFFVWHM
jgi:hypothetical protein